MAYDYVVETLVDTVSSFGNLDAVPTVVEVVTKTEVVEVITEGPQGPPGPVLLLENGSPVPPGTPPGTIIFEKDS